MNIQINSVMRQAFDDIHIKNIKPHARQLAQRVSNSLNRKVGLIGIGNGIHWNLSDKTAKQLVADGVIVKA